MEVDQVQNDNSVPIIKKQEDQAQQQNSVPIQKKQDESQSEQQNKEQISQEDEKKNKCKTVIMRLFQQIKNGCKKDICYNKYCIKNPFQQDKLKFSNDGEILKFAFKVSMESSDPFALICSDSISLNKLQLEQATDQQLSELLEDAYAFSTSFTVKQEDHEMLEESSAFEDQKIIKQVKYDSPVKKFEIDFDAVKMLFARLIKMYEGNDDKFRQAIDRLIELFTVEFDSSPKTPENALMVWRGMLMLLQLDQLFDWDWNSVLNHILKSMNASSREFRKDSHIYEEFLNQTVDKNVFLQTIQKIQSSITISIISGTFEGQNIETTVRVLDLYNDANNKRPLRARIDYKEFYNDAINKEINLKEHYEVWIMERERARIQHVPFDRLKMFTLCSFPWILDSANKAELLKISNKLQQQRQQDNFNIMDILRSGMASMYLMLEVRRSNILEDTLTKIVNPGMNFKKPLRIQFVGEPGIDEGGVRKEFFQLLIRNLFDPNYGMFNYNEKERLYWFNGMTHEPNVNFELIGILMGLAIYNNIILDVPFPMVTYKHLLFQEPTFDDLREWQPEVAQSLEFIRDYNDPNVPLEQALGINFTIQVENWGEKTEIELKPNGHDILVTEENREEYIQLYLEYIFNKQCESQLRSFKKGFYRVCEEDLMNQLFKPQELEQLICGSKKLDFHAWEKAAKYVDGYTAESPIAKWLWEIIHEFTDEQKKQFLAFCTGSDRAPILGLGSVRLYVGRHGEDSERLPSAHTCFNHLLIPEYTDKEKLRQKLLLAISNSEGFGLI